MTEDEAISWLEGHPVASQCVDQLRAYVALLLAENERQNLIAPTTAGQVWSRHIVDSAQLWDLADFGAARVVDVGSGGGLPGVVLAIMGATITLCEPRKLRAEFLRRCVTELSLATAEVHQAKGNQLSSDYAVVTARAVASPTALIDDIPTGKTFVLPRGQRFADDLADLQATYTGMFHVKRSVTSPGSSIIIATDLKRRKR